MYQNTALALSIVCMWQKYLLARHLLEMPLILLLILEEDENTALFRGDTV